MNNSNQNDRSDMPKYNVKIRSNSSEKNYFEQIGVAWENDDIIFVKLQGTQIISEGFFLFPLDPSDEECSYTNWRIKNCTTDIMFIM